MGENMAIIGAILGDIAGSRWEFGRPEDLDWQHIDLYTDDCKYTDDTVLTIATKYALDNSIPFAVAYHTFGNNYPSAGYGGSFHTWLSDDNLKPYNSYGNGSAMRVSPVADLMADMFTTKKVAEFSARCTHNHPEGIKGAVVTAMCIFMAKNGCTKTEIEKFAVEQYPKSDYLYPTDSKMKVLREEYKWDVTCQGSVPVAIRCFLDSEDYESFLRNVISLRCDTDTLCAIGGGIAEEYYHGTGFNEKELLQRYLDKKLLEYIENGGIKK